ncbi:S8/S53 family peptidase [Lentzea sp.]|uniref:S8 family peptidase n=1 Tax=Lentzea sp. TaxID=56099 RepID=UPI002BA7894B|nr:S8/S53 family peptidase [Lentzea sp.]HUQ55882.1 S8/S53 family peptidase [Lentzea sp.]
MADLDDIRYFGPPDPLDTDEAAPSPGGLPPIPEEVLERHNARVLDPKTAPALPGFPVSSTIYRADDLLIPDRQRKNFDVYSATLEKLLGLTLVDDSQGNAAFARGVLRPSDPTRPAVVDAWLALQTLRSVLSPDDMEGVGLNHLLVGTAMGGIGGSSGTLRGVPGAVNGGPYGLDELGYWRRPVSLKIPRPARLPDARVVGRRPVIAVLDTGKSKNTWLDAYPQGTTDFMVVDEELQADIDAKALPGEAPGGWEDVPFASDPLVGELSTHSGHATFITGLIQQVEPDATVLSIRVMHNDGIASSGVISYALSQLLARVVAAQSPTSTAQDRAKMVDIVSLSLGNFLEGDFGAAQRDELTKAIDELRGRGVIVVAAAGNFASSREFYPAALAKRTGGEDPVTNGGPPVISVGALNPNLTRSLFSNDNDRWVTCWARGAALVSTFPQATNAARAAALRIFKRIRPALVTENDPINFRESMESDDYSGGFAMWSGTSFATPLVVGKLAQLLLNSPVSSLAHTDTIKRAAAAIQRLGGENT